MNVCKNHENSRAKSRAQASCIRITLQARRNSCSTSHYTVEKQKSLQSKIRKERWTAAILSEKSDGPLRLENEGRAMDRCDLKMKEERRTAATLK